MFEVPALYWQLPELLRRCDFLSIGSNDLKQFLFVVDRGSSALSARYDDLAPAFLRLLAGVRQASAEAERPLSLCGEMAGDPLSAMALLALGFRSLSMVLSAVGPIRAMIRSLDLSRLGAYIEALGRQPGEAMRAALRAFARDHGVAL